MLHSESDEESNRETRVNNMCSDGDEYERSRYVYFCAAVVIIVLIDLLFRSSQPSIHPIEREHIDPFGLRTRCGSKLFRETRRGTK